MKQEALLYVVRPEGTALWLPASILESLGVKEGDRLSPAIYEGREIQRLLEVRHQEQQKREGGR